MKTMTFCLGGLVFTSLLLARPQGVVPNAPIYRAIEKHERRVDARRGTAPAARRERLDMVEVNHEADELAQLAQSIREEIALAQKGILSKDLGENLKKVQKLSKRLRSELKM